MLGKLLGQLPGAVGPAWGADSLQSARRSVGGGSEWLGEPALSVRAVWGQERLFLRESQNSTAPPRLLGDPPSGRLDTSVASGTCWGCEPGLAAVPADGREALGSCRTST